METQGLILLEVDLDDFFFTKKKKRKKNQTLYVAHVLSSSAESKIQAFGNQGISELFSFTICYTVHRSVNFTMDLLNCWKLYISMDKWGTVYLTY